jgi:NitT/TauT family transport system substrate-binding protein
MRDKLKVLLSIFIFSFFIFTILPTTILAQSGIIRPEKEKIAIGLPVPAISFLPAWVADQVGFFKEEGFSEIKIYAFRGDADVLQALASGTADINIASLIGLVSAINSGQKFKAFWAGYNMPYFEWYALPKFKSIADTKGGRYAVTKYGALTDFLTRYALRNAGLDPEKDVKILQLGGSPQSLAAMEAGQIEATILSPPSTHMAAEKGFIKVMSQKEHIAPDWPLHVVYTKEDFIAKNSNTIKAFLRATGKAIEWIKSKPEEAAKLANKQLKFKLEHCRKTIEDIKSEWYADGRLPQKGMKIFWEIAVQGGDVKEPWPNSKWLDETFLKTQDQWRR